MSNCARRSRRWARLAAALLTAALAGSGTADDPQTPEGDDRDDRRQVMIDTVDDRHWLIRAVAAMRLETWDHPEAIALLRTLAADNDWKVRSFAVRGLARRTDGRALLENLDDRAPQVMRVALLYGVRVDDDRLRQHIARQLAQRRLDDVLLGVELAALSADPALQQRAIETVIDLLPRLSEHELITLSSRLGPACGLEANAAREQWQAWADRDAVTIQPRAATPPPCWLDPAGDDADAPAAEDASALGRLSDVQFVSFRDDYLRQLRQQPIDLVICIDRTTSMRPTIDAVKASASMLIDFLEQSAASVRIGVVTYAGRPSELTALPLTDRAFTVQQFVQQIELGRGAMETVTLALQTAVEQNHFRDRALKAVVIIGDEPYQKRLRDALHEVLETAVSREIAVCAVKVGSDARRTVDEGKTYLPQFDEIAQLGGGRSADLDRPGDVTQLILALVIGGSWPDTLGDLLSVYRECVP